MKKPRPLPSVTVGRVVEARKGDYLWLMDINDKGIGPGGRASGLGAFKMARVASSNTQSIVVGDIKYNRKTGYERGKHIVVANRLFGALDKQDFALVRVHRALLADEVRTMEDPHKLLQIAQIIGYQI